MQRTARISLAIFALALLCLPVLEAQIVQKMSLTEMVQRADRIFRGQLLGVSSGTMMEELAWAEKGVGAWVNGKRVHVSSIDDPRRAAVSTGNLKSLAKSAGWEKLGEVVAAADRIRGYGDFYHYHLLAAGKIEAVIESDVNILDIAALSIIVEEAGGVFTDLNGAAVGLETRSVLAANPALHAKYLERLSGWVP